MLCYWILRRKEGGPVGLVRVQNDRVLLKLTVPVPGTFTLFSDDAAVPITPESETRLPCPKAVLGTDGDRVTCFAAAEKNASIASFCNRLSRFCTIKASASTDPAKPDKHVPLLSHIESADAESADKAKDLSRFSTSYVDSVSDSTRDAQAFSLLLQHAEAFYAAYEDSAADDMVQNKDRQTEESGGFDLFSQEFPGVRWRYVDGTDVLPHYEGMWKQPNGPTLHILAVRGHGGPRPPRALLGFTRFLRDAEGNGYWLRLTPLSKDF